MQLLQEKSNKYYIFWVCACSLRYPAYNAHAPYCHLRSTPLYNIFSHYLTNCTIFEKKIDEHKMSFVFYLQILIVSHSKNKWVRYDKKMYVGLHVQYRFFWSYFNENCIFSTDFRKILKYKFSWKSVQWKQSCSMRKERRTERWTDRYDEAISRFWQFGESAYKNQGSKPGPVAHTHTS